MTYTWILIAAYLLLRHRDARYNYPLEISKILISKIELMKYRKIPLLILTVLLAMSSCQKAIDSKSISESDAKIEKNKILECLKSETQTAFARDYEFWKTHWVHRPSISKTYMNFADTTFSEMKSWKEIDDFVRTYIEEHPEPVPPPAQPENIDIKLYGSGAWVSYEILDEVFGKKRETRLMEKDKGKWKIAGMHTTIYGFDK